MNEFKTAPMSFRLKPGTRELLALCAEREHRSMASLLEYLVHTHAEAHGVALPVPAKANKNTTKKP